MVKAYLVNHTHWDREWYFTTQDAQVLSEQLFTDVLDELEAHPEANFTLDGQTSIIDEYIEIHPEEIDRIKKLVNRRQLYIGPWYTQTDAMIPSSESIIRNLVIGINDSKKKYGGNPMMLGYLPDTFGFNAQLPMLLKQVGIHDFICWRGINFKRQAGSVYFKWKGLGNCEVYVASFPLGYYTGQIALESKKHLAQFVEKRLDKGIDFESKNGNNDEVLIPSGIDQMNIVHNMSKTLKEINKLSKHETVIGSYPEFMEKLRHRELNTFQGELRYPTYSRVHRTIGSVRSRFKRKNFELEEFITKRIEPLMVIAQNAGVRVSNGIILKLWKKLLECQPHDTIGGCVSDNVAADIEHRFKECYEIAEGIENYIKKRLSQRLKLSANDILVFNTSVVDFSGTKEIRFMSQSKQIKFADKYNARVIAEEYTPVRKNIMQQTSKGFEFKDEKAYYKLTALIDVVIPSLGYTVISFQDSDENIAELYSIDGDTISNSKVSVSYSNESITIKKGDKTLENALEIWDCANDGDTYDFSPLRGDREIRLNWNGKITKLVSKNSQRLVLTGSWSLPFDLNSRLKKTNLKKLNYTLTIELERNSSFATFKLDIDNTVLSHRLRLRLNVVNKLSKTIAQIQGGFRNTENYKIDANWAEEFVEKPVNIYNYDKIVGSSDGIFIFTKGMKEYERINDGIFVTLMATTGELGKPNLLWRPGRASGDTTSVGHTMTPTPSAQELGNNSFEFAIKLYDDFTENEVANDAERFLEPSISYQNQRFNLFVNRLDNKIWDIEFSDKLPKLSRTQSFLKIELNGLVVSALYPSYTVKNAHILRLSNQGNNKVDISHLQKEGYLVVNALEETVEQNYMVDAYDMITLLKVN